MKSKLKFQNYTRKIKSRRLSEKVSSQVRSKSLSWLVFSNILKLFVLIFFGALVLFPFYYMIVTSLMTDAEATDTTHTHLAPASAQWGNYSDALKDGYWQAIFYSFLITALTLVIKTIIAMLLGYAFSFKQYRFKKALWYFFLSLMMLPEVALMSGQYQMIVKLGWHAGTGVIIGLFVPFIASVFSAIMFKNAFEQIPDRTREAAMVDGSNGMSYFFRIALPMIMPTTLTVVILTAFASWNSYLWPALLLQGKEVQTVPTWVFLTGRDEQGNMIIPIRMAGTVLAILPMLIVYFGFRNRIMRAISRQGSAIKG